MKNQKGFTLIEVLLVIIALSMVGGVGYYVYDSNRDRKSDSSSAVKSESEGEQRKNENDAKSNTFKVAEAGFEMTLPAGLEGLKYQITSSQDEGKTQQDLAGNSYVSGKSVSFTMTETEACGITALGVVSFYNVDPSTLTLPYVGMTTVPIKDQFANLSMPDGGICPEAPSLASLTEAKIKLFADAFRTAKATN